MKKVLAQLVDTGILDTGAEAETRWYCFRRECENHYTGKIIPNLEFRNQLRRFIGIYEEQ